MDTWGFVPLRRLGVARRRVLGTVDRVSILRLDRLMGTVRRGFNMSTTTPMTMTTTTPTTNTTTIRRGDRFSMVLGRTNTRGVRIVGTIHRVATLNLGRTGTLISNTPGRMGANMTGTRTRRVGGGLRRTNTAMRLGWSFCRR